MSRVVYPELARYRTSYVIVHEVDLREHSEELLICFEAVSGVIDGGHESEGVAHESLLSIVGTFSFALSWQHDALF